MNVTPRQLKAFIAVAECNSFADACALVHLSQPALSIAIKNLEQAVGGRLLIRTTRTLSLSPEGQSFLPVARRLVADWDTALNDLHNLFAKRIGKLAIAVMPSFAANQLPPVLRDFRREYPNINVLVNDVITEVVEEWVRSGRVEIGITFRPEHLTDLNFNPLFNDAFVVALPSDHTLAGRDRLQWADMAGQTLLLLQRPSAVRGLIDRTLADNGIETVLGLEAHQLSTVGKMVSCGIGISVVPSLSVEQMEALGCVCRALEEPVVSRQVGIITRKRYPLSAAAEAMARALEARFGQD